MQVILMYQQERYILVAINCYSKIVQTFYEGDKFMFESLHTAIFVILLFNWNWKLLETE